MGSQSQHNWSWIQSKNLTDKLTGEEATFKWGAARFGFDEGDGWVRFQLQGTPTAYTAGQHQNMELPPKPEMKDMGCNTEPLEQSPDKLDSTDGPGVLAPETADHGEA